MALPVSKPGRSNKNWVLRSYVYQQPCRKMEGNFQTLNLPGAWEVQNPEKTGANSRTGRRRGGVLVGSYLNSREARHTRFYIVDRHSQEIQQKKLNCMQRQGRLVKRVTASGEGKPVWEEKKMDCKMKNHKEVFNRWRKVGPLVVSRKRLVGWPTQVFSKVRRTQRPPVLIGCRMTCRHSELMTPGKLASVRRRSQREGPEAHRHLGKRRCLECKLGSEFGDWETLTRLLNRQRWKWEGNSSSDWSINQNLKGCVLFQVRKMKNIAGRLSFWK